MNDDSMTPEDWQRLSDLLSRARELDPAARAAFLDAACEDNDGLRSEADALLALDEPNTLLDRPIFNIQDGVLPIDPNLGLHLGPYELERRLGQGGMGTVYLARRRDEFDQKAAIKLIQRGMDSDDLLRRFRNERQILARLEHASIARLLDGGTADDGRPYFVMEYVDGEPVDRYCRRLDLSLRARLDLFRQICAAVHFSHQHLVVHRDLKPSNILVSYQDGAPKLLDFGIAKLLQPDPGDLTTLPGQRPMTFRYASPEQVQEDHITTASDIYSLGILLYELLTDRHPQGLDDLSDLSKREIQRRICEEDPAKPSAVDGPFGSRLRGDLDAILLKVLRKEPTQRYGSVVELSEDIQRFQSGLPVAARQGTWPYLAVKFIRLHRLAVAVMLLILAFGTVATVLWRRAETQRQEAETQRQEAVAEEARADRVSRMLLDVFGFADPNEARGSSLTALEILERGRVQYASALSEDPRLSELIADLLSQVYRNLGLYEAAGDITQQRLESLRQRHPGDSREMAKRINNVGAFLFDIGQYQEAETRFSEAWQMRQRLGQEDSDAIRNMNNLASTMAFRGAFEEAEALYQRGLELRRRLDGHDHVYVASSLRHMGYIRHLQGDLEQAEDYLRQALAIRQREYGLRDTRVVSIWIKLAAVLADQGRTFEAEHLYLEALEVQQALGLAQHLRTAGAQKELAALLLSLSDPSAAELDTVEILLRRALVTFSRHRPEGDAEIAHTESLLGRLLMERGDAAAAETCLREAHAALEAQRESHVLYIGAASDHLQTFDTLRP